jgi:CRISPR/Cas system-associated endonuclease Cas1
MGMQSCSQKLEIILTRLVLTGSACFLHERAAGKTPLASDIHELSRWLIDLFVLQVLEDKELGISHFIVTENYRLAFRESTSKILRAKISPFSCVAGNEINS